MLWFRRSSARLILKKKIYCIEGCLDFPMPFSWQCQYEAEKLRGEYKNPQSLASPLNKFGLFYLVFSLSQSLKDHFFSIISGMERWAQWLLDSFWVVCDSLQTFNFAAVEGFWPEALEILWKYILFSSGLALPPKNKKHVINTSDGCSYHSLIRYLM